MLKTVVIESPYAGDVERNTEYARRAMLDSLGRNEAPFAGHLLYTQILDDKLPSQRAQGLACHLLWLEACSRVVVYEDYGVSEGMKLAIREAVALEKEVVRRTIGKNP